MHEKSRFRFLTVGYTDQNIFINNDWRKSISLKADGAIIRTNHAFDNVEFINFPYFIMDQHEFELLRVAAGSIKDQSEKEEMLTESLSSLGGLMKNIGSQQIYIRRIPLAHFDNDLHFRVFTNDVLDAIQILMDRQKMESDELKGKLQGYKKQWKSRDGVHQTINLLEFGKILEDFDLNKDQITIAHDINYELNAQNMFVKNGDHVAFYSPDAALVMDLQQAVFHIFSSTVCGMNFSKTKCKRCKNSQKCMEDYKRSIIDAMREYQKLPEGSYVPKEDVDKKIAVLQKHCIYLTQKNLPKRDYQLLKLGYKEERPLKQIQEIANFYDLDVVISGNNCKVWGGRYSLMKGWSNTFFGISDMDLMIMVDNALLLKIDPMLKMAYHANHVMALEVKLLKTVTNGRELNQVQSLPGFSPAKYVETLQCFRIFKSNVVADVKKYEDLDSKELEGSKTLGESVSSTCKECPATSAAMRLLQVELEKAHEQMERMMKTIGKVEDLEENLKIANVKVSDFENQSNVKEKKIQDMELEMKKKDAKMEILEAKLKDFENLKASMKKFLDA